jgi:hypothetical protein
MDRDTDLVRLADELVDEIAGARRHFAGLRDAAGGSDAREGDAPNGQQPPSEKAELAVVSMALAGSTREEARAHLEEDFGIEDADALLDRAPEWTRENERRPIRRFARRLRPRR